MVNLWAACPSIKLSMPLSPVLAAGQMSPQRATERQELIWNYGVRCENSNTRT